MKLGPKYKIARRLGAPIFEKTQTQKFKMSTTEKGPGSKRPQVKSEFAKQMLEKQKTRFTYGLGEKQFSKYVKNIIESKAANPTNKLYEVLESRLDNIVSRLGLVSTRRFARQVVSHGHITVNGRKVTIPSYMVKPGEIIAIREGSQKTTLFTTLDERLKDVTIQNWLTWDGAKKQGSMLKVPSLEGQDVLFDLGAVMEFYKR
jgi:small subunit ribosomal protein S4